MTLQEAIVMALNKIGVTRAGTADDGYRWSPSDLATDLADELIGFDIVADAVRRRIESTEPDITIS